jgi:hypothetical protein
VMCRSLSCLLVPKVRNLGFVLNRNLTPIDQYKAVYQRIYSVLRSVKPHARYTHFGVRKRLVVSLILIMVMLFTHNLTLRSILVCVMFMKSLVESMFLISCLLLSVFRW